MRLGKDKQAISLALFLLLSASSTGQAVKSFKYHFDGNLHSNNAMSVDQSVVINYSVPELNVENFSNENGTFYRVSIPGHIPTAITGEPELPVFARLITIPAGAGYIVKISDVKSTKIKPSGKNIKGILFPVQEGETKSLLQQKNHFSMNKTVYSINDFIASDTVKIEPLGKVRNSNLANLIISPVRYNPHSNILEVITSMKIEISFSYTSSSIAKSIFPKSALFNESLSRAVLNFNPEDVVTGYSDQPVTMVILTDTAFRKQLEPFFRWKTQKGYRLKVLYKGVGLAGNTYSELKDTLTKIYKASSETEPPPEYLLIIGNINRVPYYGTGNITDLYYGEFDGNGDYIPEMYIGRLPVADTTELKSVVNKIIQYEKFQYADTNKFYSGAIATAGYDAVYATNMNGQVKYAISNYLTKENSITENHFYYPDALAAKDSIIKLVNKGISFINYTGHGEAAGWLHLNIKSPDIPSLVNKNMYPFIISNACRTAQFDLASSFGNQMLVSQNKGAIGFIGCSNDSYWDEDYYWAVGPGIISADPTYESSGLGAFDRLFHSHGEASSDWYYTMGQINYAGNLAVSASTTARKKYYWETYNLVGDPSITPIIGKPDSFNISLPDTLPNGLKSLSLNLDPFAYIAVSHFDTLWDASFASVSGSVVIDIPAPADDSCLIVITGQNKYPIIKTIYFKDINGEFLNLRATSINDIQGNNNNKVDFGETFYLKLTVSNLGLTDANNVYAKISSTSNWFTINNDSVFLGTLPGKSENINSDLLSITVSDNVPNMSMATIDLIIKDPISEKHYTIDITIHSPDLQILNCIMDDSVLGNDDHIADPGETFNLVFKVQNQGSSDISGQFNIVCPSNEATIIEPSVKSGILKFGEITDIPIMVKLSDTLPAGSYISISSMLDCTPFVVNKDFSFRVGRMRESFEASSFNVFPWINTSSIPWIISGNTSYDGSISARSGAISHNSSTSLVIRTIYSAADSVNFFYRVSSEPNYDFLSFRLNGTEILKKSGETPWTKISVPVLPGLNKMEWIYKKDNSVSLGSDAAWIDMIDFASSSAVTYIQRDIQLAKIVTPVQKDQLGMETVTVKVRNLGKNILNGFTLAYNINDQTPPVKQYFENTILPYGDSVTVSFKTKADLSKYGIYNILIYGTGNNDDYVNNDTLDINLENIRIKETLTVFPNPFRDQLTLFINAPLPDKLRISIIDNKGIKLYDIEKDVLPGKNSILITDALLSPALYYLNIRGTTINETIPVLKINK